MPGTVLRTHLCSLIKSSPQPYEVGSVVPVLQMSTPSRRDLETLPKCAQL